MSAPIPKPSPACRLDVFLAERVLEGGLRGQRLLAARQGRDVSWIIGQLGLRGLHITCDDVLAALDSRPGRFRPGQTEFELIRGLRTTIDRIEDRAERGERPYGAALMDVHGWLTACLSNPALRLRREADPWDAVPGLTYAAAGAIDLDAAPGSLGHHPVAEAAVLFRSFVRVAPFRDFNIMTASLGASWMLLAHGYPPFMPQATDRSTMHEVLAGGRGSETGLINWVAEVVLVGARAFYLASS